MSSRGSDGVGGQENRVNPFSDSTNLTDQLSPFHLQRGQNSVPNTCGVGTFFFIWAGEIPVHTFLCNFSFMEDLLCLPVHSVLEANYLT